MIVFTHDIQNRIAKGFRITPIARTAALLRNQPGRAITLQCRQQTVNLTSRQAQNIRCTYNRQASFQNPTKRINPCNLSFAHTQNLHQQNHPPGTHKHAGSVTSLTGPSETLLNGRYTRCQSILKKRHCWQYRNATITYFMISIAFGISSRKAATPAADRAQRVRVAQPGRGRIRPLREILHFDSLIPSVIPPPSCALWLARAGQ